MWWRIGFLFALALAAGFLVEKTERIHHEEGTVEQGKTNHTNRLAREKSPYLLQHANNPVDWHAWGDEAFEKAKKEDKPIFLSIGYSTCHWCHVMERESFENDRIAKIMNENFVCIKVDREERPDIDQIYMAAVQGMTGSGGWPLSVFLTPDREPFFGGTYFPPDRRWGRPGFDEILGEIARVWRQERKKAVDSAKQITSYLKVEKDASPGGELTIEGLKRAFGAFEGMYDPQDGGFGPAPKFPRSEAVSLLFRIYRRTGEKRALQMATRTLEKMARGGIYDHVGGGFHRYSTDAQWLVPHFEKMLYDNALLAKAYLEAFQIEGNEMWAGVARETLDYVLREMTSPEGGFYSAQDADSEGEEGKFYVWTEEELKGVLTDSEFKKVKFEGKNILSMTESAPWSVRYKEPLKSALKKLLESRAKRIPPLKDDKVLASWNGLMISAMAYGAQVLGDARYLQAAKNAADFILKKMWDGKTLKRRHREGEVRFNGSLDDYAFLIAGLLDLYETDFDPRWFEAARNLQKKSDELFWDQKEGGYFYTDLADSSLLTRTKEVYDGAVPSGNSIAALNLLRLYALTLEEGYRKRTESLFRAFSGFVSSHPQASPAFLMAVDFATDSFKEIVIAGGQADPGVQKILQELHRSFIPNKVLALADQTNRDKSIPICAGKVPIEGVATIYVCEEGACKRPVRSSEEAHLLIETVKTYRLK